MKWLKWGLAAGGLVVAAGVMSYSLAGGSGTAQAQTPPASQSRAVSSYETQLAAQLGISVDQLQTAQKNAMTAVITQAEADGKITADQAAKLQNLQPGQRPHLLRRAASGIKGAIGNVLDAAAKTIGISNSDLKTQLQSGQSLAQIAAQHNIARTDLTSGIMANVNAQLATAVQSGKLTQDQADKLANALSSRLDQLIDRSGGWGMGMGHGGAKPVAPKAQ